MFILHSSQSEREVIFSSRTANHFVVEVHGVNLTASRPVWCDPDNGSPADFFFELADERKPLRGNLEWESLEGELKISAAFLKTGKVVLTIEIRSQIGEEEETCLTTGLVMEFGQLEFISREARGFFRTK